MMRLWVLAVAAALWLAGCATQAPPLPTQKAPTSATTATTDEDTAAGEVAPTSGWHRASTPPLSPRWGSVVVWTGEEAVVIGGRDTPLCPSNANCVAPEEPALADGAAYNPTKDTWRSIAPAPVPIEPHATTAATDSQVIVQTDDLLMAYAVETDAWSTLTPPPQGRIMAAGSDLVAVSGTDEFADADDWAHDPAADDWNRLPDDPLGRTFDRQMVWTGDALVLLASTLDQARQDPTFVEAALLSDPFGDDPTWEVLPTSTLLGGYGGWITSPWGIINLAEGGADGGEVNGYGRTLPFGGVLRLDPRGWRELPDRPSVEEGRLAGVPPGTDGRTLVSGGWALDLATAAWAPIPLDSSQPTDETASAWIGDRVVRVGGARWNDEYTTATFSDEAWVWFPPWQDQPEPDATDVALATPEPYGRPATEDPGAGGEPDGRLDCAEDRFVDMFSDFGEGGGAPDPGTALHQAMDPKAELAGGEVIIRNESYATVVVDNLEVATAESIELPDGTWAVDYVRACDESLLPID